MIQTLNRKIMNRDNIIPKGYKETPISVTPSNWKVKRLGEVCIFLDHKRIPLKESDRQKRKGKYPYYGASGIIDYVDSYIFNGEYILLGEDGANIITRSSPLAFRTSGKIWVNNHAHILDVKENNNIDFLCALLESLNYTKYNTGTAQPKLNRDICEHIQLCIPPFAEQNKIADILNLWDKAIEKQSQLISQLELRKNGLMQQLLTGKKRLSGFKGKWKTYILSEICKRVVRKNSEGNTNVMTISAQQGFVKQTDFFNKSVASESLDGYFLVKKDEFCYNKSYSNGYPMGAIKRLKEAEKAVVTTLYICFKVIDEKTTDINFLEQLFNIGILNKGLAKVANEGGRAHGLLNVTSRDFFELKINIPTIEEQKSISKIIKSVDKEIEVEKNKFKFFCNQKTGLMQQLLTGKKRVI